MKIPIWNNHHFKNFWEILYANCNKRFYNVVTYKSTCYNLHTEFLRDFENDDCFILDFITSNLWKVFQYSYYVCFCSTVIFNLIFVLIACSLRHFTSVVFLPVAYRSMKLHFSQNSFVNNIPLQFICGVDHLSRNV